MNNPWFLFSEKEQHQIIAQTAAKLGFSEVVIEKDWWVCMVLRAVFQSKFKDFIVFKGGTSLSKAYGIIDRFSEDVDLIIDYHFLGFEELQSKSQIKKLRKASGNFIIGEFREELIKQLLILGISNSLFHIEYNPQIDDTSDPNILELYYKSVVPSETNIQKKVIIEMGARALSEPSERREINSFIDQTFKGYNFIFSEFNVEVTVPTKTFLEKIFLLHEEFSKPPEKIQHNKMSRHLYDLERLMSTKYGMEAIADKELFETIANFRKKMNSRQGIRFENHKRTELQITPPSEMIELWEKDYKLMQENMIVGDSKSFDELIENLKIIQKLLKQ